MKLKCIKNFEMADPDEPISFVAGKSYELLKSFVLDDAENTKVFEFINEQGISACLEYEDVTNHFEYMNSKPVPPWESQF